MDIRTQHTRETLREALLSCLEEMSMRDVSVAEVCRRAGVDRATFYRNYKSIDDIIVELEDEQLEQFRFIMQDDQKSGKELLMEILDLIDNAKSMYNMKEGSAFTERFRNKLLATAKEFGLQKWKESLPKVDEQGVELSYEALLAGTLHAVLIMGDKVSNEKKATLIMDMIYAYIQSRA